MTSATGHTRSNPQQRAKIIITDHIIVSMSVSFVPVPVLDLALIAGTQLNMIRVLSKVYGVPFRKKLARSLLSTLVGSGLPMWGARAAASWGKSIPVVGTFTGAVSLSILSGASTYAVGKLFMWHFSRGGTLENFDATAQQAEYQASLEEGKRVAKKLRKTNKARQATTDATATRRPWYKPWAKSKPKAATVSAPTSPVATNPPSVAVATHNPSPESIPMPATPTPPPIAHPTTTPDINPTVAHSLSQQMHTPPPPKHKHRYPIITLLLLLITLVGLLAAATLALHDRLIAPHFPQLHAYIHEHILPPEYTLHLAIVTPLTGEQAHNGIEMLQSVRLRIEELNAQGGIHGRYIQLLEYDDENDPAKAADLARQIAEDERVLGVIGHYASSTSLAAATVYKTHGLPAISGSATADSLTKDNDWYFRIIFNDSLQASLAANYLYRVLAQQQVDIIYTQSAYGESLTNAFTKTAEQIGLKVDALWALEPTENNINQVLQRLTAALQQQADMPQKAIFIAAHSDQAAQIIKALHPYKDRLVIMGGDALSTSTFMQNMQQYAQEKTMPGYYSDGVYTVFPFLNALSSRQAQLFHLSFIQKYQREPAIAAAMYYDTALVMLEAIANSEAWQVGDIKARRTALQQRLWGFANIETAIAGVTGYTYFNANGDVVKTIPVGVYQKGIPIIALEQFQPFSGLDKKSSELDLFKLALDDQLVNLDGHLMRRARVVYTGLHFNEIDVLDVEYNIFDANFYLWFRFQGEDFVDADLNFRGLYQWMSGMEMGVPVVEQTSHTEHGTTTRTYHVKGTFKFTPDYRMYPLDKQILPVQFNHNELPRDQLIYVVDAIGMGLSEQNGSVIVDDLQRHQKFIADDWNFNRMFFFQDELIYDSSLGLPNRLDHGKPLEHSQYNAMIEISRQYEGILIKHLLPAGLMVLLGYLSFFLPSSRVPFRVILGVTMLVTITLFHAQLNLQMPAVNYSVLLEYLYYLGYVLAMFVITMGILAHCMTEHHYIRYICDVRRINLLGRLLYPVIVLIWMAAVLG